MRIDTWNLDEHLRPGTVDQVLALDADVLLLTEVPTALVLPGHHMTQPGPRMMRGQRWAAVASRHPLLDAPSPHPVSAAAVVLGTTYVASVLPWKGAPQGPWTGSSLSARMEAAVDELEPFLAGQERQVWGGDWNQTMHGPFDGSSKAGRARLQLALERLELSLPTQELPRGALPMFTIDHIAVPGTTSKARHVAVDRRLSDHDAYVVDL